MKKKLSYLALSLSLMLTVFAPSLAQAHVTALSTTDAAETNTTTTAKTDDATTRTARLDNYKKQLKETLTDAVKVRIAARCVTAQALVKGKTTNNGLISTARTTAYDAIVADLQSLSASLSARSIDATTLDANIAILKTKITTFTTANTTYQQALTDLGALDCKTDPVAFKAALTVARTNQEAVFKAAQDIRTYLTGTIKPTLKALKTAVGAANQ